MHTVHHPSARQFHLNLLSLTCQMPSNCEVHLNTAEIRSEIYFLWFDLNQLMWMILDGFRFYLDNSPKPQFLACAHVTHADAKSSIPITT